MTNLLSGLASLRSRVALVNSVGWKAVTCQLPTYCQCQFWDPIESADLFGRGAPKRLSTLHMGSAKHETASGSRDAFGDVSSVPNSQGKRMNGKNLLFIGVLVLISLSAGNGAFAQNPGSQSAKQDAAPGKSAVSGYSQAEIDQDIALLRKDLRSEKKQVVAANMNLSDTEAEKFWPVYDQYAADLSRINDKKAELIKGYWQNFQAMDGDQAESYIRQRAAVEQSVMELRLSYIPRFRRVLSGRQTALFSDRVAIGPDDRLATGTDAAY
jgi:hypothetical protein